MVVKKYENPPIVEALIDIRLREAIPLSRLDSIFDLVKADYPVKEDRIEFIGEFKAGRDFATSTSQKLVGYLFRSADDHHVFQARENGFSLSRLKPYETWDSFAAEARKRWSDYRRVVDAKDVSRIGLRYINRLDLPLPLNDFQDYLQTLPQIGAEMPHGVSRFLMRLEIPDPTFDGTIVVHEVLVPPEVPETIAVVLDIDVFKYIETSDEDLMWEQFSQLRKKKNQVFEASITDNMRERIS